jgi:hypothetical protein
MPITTKHGYNLSHNGWTKLLKFQMSLIKIKWVITIGNPSTENSIIIYSRFALTENFLNAAKEPTLVPSFQDTIR